MPVVTLPTSAGASAALFERSSPLPTCLVCAPDRVRRPDGTYAPWSLRSDGPTSCGSALELAVRLQLESHGGLRRIVSAADLAGQPLGAGMPEAGVLAAAGLRPTFVVEVVVAGRVMVQAVSVMSGAQAEAHGPEGIETMRRAYLALGFAWGVVTERSVEWGRAATLLFLSECRRSVCDPGVLAAVSEAIDGAEPGDLLANVLIEAALVAGVDPRAAATAYGWLLCGDGAGVNLSARVIRTDRPIGDASSGDDDTNGILDAWQAAAIVECSLRAGPEET